MFNQEMQNAQESAEAETPAGLKQKCSSIFRSLHFSSPWTANIPNQQTGTTTTTEIAKILGCNRRLIVPGTGITLRQNRSTSYIIHARAARH